MRNLTTLLASMVLTIGFCLTSCSSSPNTDKLTSFIDGAFTYQTEDINEKEPLASILSIAKKQAAKVIGFNKDNASTSLAEAQNYKHVFMTIGNHTIVKITDLNDCKQSTSWGCQMPYGKALVQNDGLNSEQDYINQIIGKPDNQTRWLLLFN